MQLTKLICREGGQKQQISRPFTSRVLANFVVFYCMWRKDTVCMEVTGRRRHCKQLCGGMEIPCTCRLVFSCLSKVKINRLKELLESKICQ